MPCEACKQSYLDSYKVTVATMRQADPLRSDHDLRIAAATVFRPKYAILKQRGMVEKTGDEIYENGEFTMIGGKMYFPETGELAESLHENQLMSSRITKDPARYSKADHERTLLVQESLAKGATIVRTAFDGVDGVHRDIVEYRYDPVTNRGKIIVHDLSKQHGSLDMTRMKQAVLQESKNLRAVIQSENVFVLTDAPAERSRHVEINVRALEGRGILEKGYVRLLDKPDFRVASHQAVHHTMETIDYVGRRVFADATETIQSVKRWAALKLLDERRNEHTRQSSLVRNKTPYLFEQTTGLPFSERPTTQKIRRRPVRLRETVANYYATMLRRQEVLKFVEKTGLGVAAAPLILASFTEKPPTSVRAVEKSVVRHTKKELKRRQKRRKLIVVSRTKTAEAPKQSKVERTPAAKKDELHKLKQKTETKIVKERRAKKKKVNRGKVYMEHPTGYRIYTIRARGERAERRKRKRGLEKGVNTKAIAGKLTFSLVERREGWRRRELHRWQKLRRGKDTSVSELWAGKRMTVKERRRPRAGYRRGLVLQEVALRSRERKEQKHFKKFPTGKKMERLAFWQPTPWILLSIIWYLAAIREQGRGYAQSRKKRSLPKQAVIFAYQ